MKSTLTASDTPRRARFRFSVKTVFILVTLVVLWLGYRQFQHLQHLRRVQSAKALAQSLHAIELVVQSNLKTPPLETAIRLRPTLDR